MITKTRFIPIVLIIALLSTAVVYYIISIKKRPYVVLTSPENGTQYVNENASVFTSIIRLPNGRIDTSSLTPATIYLTEKATGALVSTRVTHESSGKVLKLVPTAPLKFSTTYVFTITDSVKDISGARFKRSSTTFTTSAIPTSELLRVKFDKIKLPGTTGKYSSLAIGPDNKLYALSIDGIIKRFTINKDGTFQKPELFYSLQDNYGSRKPRLAIGLVFDKSATANNPVVWVTHSFFSFSKAPDWNGRLSRLSGANLQHVEDVLINLPQSSKDHLTNSIAFGLDSALYLTQGSNTAMGMADKTWSNRPEHLLSAAVLRLDLKRLKTLPINVKTREGGGTYDPYAPDAPLTIYATGLRNAYDLLWHSNGELYVPTNGSSAGGNCPTSISGFKRPNGTSYSGPLVSSILNVQQVQSDFLFRVEKDGYYGHPNPIRGEYVMNGGNPTALDDPAEVEAYPVGTLPDANWRGYAFDFQKHQSPNGVIEYKSSTFDGALKGKLMVVRYSRGSDIIILTPGGFENNIVSFTEGLSIEGLSGFILPLDIIEDLKNGNIYVSEFGGECITLLRPKIILEQPN